VTLSKSSSNANRDTSGGEESDRERTGRGRVEKERKKVIRGGV